MKPAYVYIVECADRTFYIGAAIDVERRVRQHNKGRGSKYTRSRMPVVLVYKAVEPTWSLALKLEARLKKLTHREKVELINAYRSDMEEPQ